MEFGRFVRFHLLCCAATCAVGLLMCAVVQIFADIPSSVIPVVCASSVVGATTALYVALKLKLLS